jgi:hypothetical protein
MSLVASTGPSRGRSQRSLLVSVGTTFRTDKDNIVKIVQMEGAKCINT